MAAAIPPLSAPAPAAGFPPEPGTPQCDTFAPQCDTFAVRPAVRPTRATGGEGAGDE